MHASLHVSMSLVAGYSEIGFGLTTQFVWWYCSQGSSSLQAVQVGQNGPPHCELLSSIMHDPSVWKMAKFSKLHDSKYSVMSSNSFVNMRQLVFVVVPLKTIQSQPPMEWNRSQLAMQSSRFVVWTSFATVVGTLHSPKLLSAHEQSLFGHAIMDTPTRAMKMSSLRAMAETRLPM